MIITIECTQCKKNLVVNVDNIVFETPYCVCESKSWLVKNIASSTLLSTMAKYQQCYDAYQAIFTREDHKREIKECKDQDKINFLERCYNRS